MKANVARFTGVVRARTESNAVPVSRARPLWIRSPGLEYARSADAERLTGYRVGGISPFAQKKRVPIAIDQAALTESRVLLNGGQRGLQIQLEPNDARKALDALVRPLTV